MDHTLVIILAQKALEMSPDVDLATLTLRPPREARPGLINYCSCSASRQQGCIRQTTYFGFELWEEID